MANSIFTFLENIFGWSSRSKEDTDRQSSHAQTMQLTNNMKSSSDIHQDLSKSDADLSGSRSSLGAFSTTTASPVVGASASDIAKADCMPCKLTPFVLYLCCAGYFHYQKKYLGHWFSLFASSGCLLLAGHYLQKNLLNGNLRHEPDQNTIDARQSDAERSPGPPDHGH